MTPTLTTAQSQALKSNIQGDTTLNSIWTANPNSDGAVAIAALYNLTATPDFWGWKTLLGEDEIVSATSIDATNWSWPAFIARSAGEQNGWSRMFATGAVNPALNNVRQAFADIFSGSQNNAPAQRAHLVSMSRRKVTRVEKLFAAGTGSTASPATMATEGPLSYPEVINAMGS